MNIVHISNSVSEASANTKLHNALLKENINSKIIVLSHSGEIAETYDLKRNLFWKIYDLIRNKIEELKLRKVDIEYGFPFSTGNIGYPLYKNDLVKNADVVHLHWICGVLSIKDIYHLKKLNKPIVWTCHDSWPFTGGCHVRYGCNAFTSTCTGCKNLKLKGRVDYPNKIFKRKDKLLGHSDISFIAPSSWMRDNISASKVFGKNKVYVIPNAIDINQYSPLQTFEIDRILGGNYWKNNINILFGAGDIKTPYKGYKYLISVLDMLYKTNLSDAKRIVLHIVGGNNSELEIEKKYTCVRWGYVKEPQKMAAIYNIADIMLYPSLDDNLPNMVMESMACATPVVAFRTGGIPDMIEHKVNGYLADYKNVEDMVKGLYWVINNNIDNEIGIKAREKVVNSYSEEIIAKKHIELYKALLKHTEDED